MTTGSLLGRTTAPTLTSCSYAGATNDPDTALEDETYSGGIGTLKKGAHSITIVVSTAPYENGGAFIRIDEALQGETRETKAEARSLKRKKFFG